MSSDESFSLWRHGCLLSFGGYTRGTHCLRSCIKDVHSELVDRYQYSKNEWTVERAGWIIAHGFINRNLGDSAVYGYNDEYQKEWEDTIAFIHSLADTEPVAIGGERIGLVPSVEELELPKLYLHDGSIRDTTLMQATKNVDVFEEKRVYKITGVVGGNVVLSRFSPILASFDKDGISVSYSKVIELEKVGALRAVMIALERTSVKIQMVKSIDGGSRHALPEFIRSFGLNGAQLARVSECMADKVNLTPLLNRNLHVTDEFITALKLTKQDLRPMVGRSFDADSLNVISNALRTGINVKPFISEELNAEYLQLMMSDAMQTLLEISGAMQRGGKSNTVSDVIAAARTFGIDASHCSTDTQVDATIYGKVYSIESVVTDLLENGIEYPDGSIALRWSNVKNRQELYKFLSARDLVINGRAWSDVLSDIFDKALYVVYSKDTGLGINTWYGICCRDYNSIVLYDQAHVPIWRTICVNEEYLNCGDFPE